MTFLCFKHLGGNDAFDHSIRRNLFFKQSHKQRYFLTIELRCYRILSRPKQIQIAQQMLQGYEHIWKIINKFFEISSVSLDVFHVLLVVCAELGQLIFDNLFHVTLSQIFKERKWDCI